MILMENGQLALTRKELEPLGSTTLPLEQSTPGRQFEHPQLGILEYQNKQGEYWIVRLTKPIY